MDKLYSWKVRRSGSGISVAHSCGKITGIAEIAIEDGCVIARAGDGRRFELVIA
ncbi:MAG: hypothetical protein ABIS14_12795 [Sphingomonas sp.]